MFQIFKEKQNDEEKAKQKARSEKYKIDIKLESNGKFMISDVLPGKYSLFVNLPSYGFKSVGSVFEVSSGQLVELGKIEIDIE